MEKALQELLEAVKEWHRYHNSDFDTQKQFLVKLDSAWDKYVEAEPTEAN